MRNAKKRTKGLVAAVIAGLLLVCMPCTVFAGGAPSQEELALLMQTPEYQAALAQQQAAALAAQQQAAALAAQQQAMLLAQQQAAALLAQQQAAALAQYQAQLAAAQMVQNNAAYLHEHAITQSYILTAIQAQQRAQYESMINRMGLDYKGQLMENYTKNQNAALNSFKGYNGL